MKIHAISVDEQNHKHSVTLESGETFTGYQAVDEIMLRKNPVTNKLEPYLDGWARRYLRGLKKKRR